MKQANRALAAYLALIAGKRSKQSISTAAGLSRNYFGQVLAGRAIPKPAQLAKLLDVLGASPEQREEAMRLASQLPPRGETEPSRAARRVAWPWLFHIGVNQLLLPRGELDADLKRGLKADALGLLTREALDSVLYRFVERHQEQSPPDAAMSMIEERFGHLDRATLVQNLRDHRGDLTHIEGLLNLVYSEPIDRIRRRLLFLLRPRDYAGNDPWVDLSQAPLGYTFGVAIFPRLLARAGRAWPMDRFEFEFARRGPEPQRQLWRRLRAGMTDAELDQALLGRGEFGASLSRVKPIRPLIDPFSSDAIRMGFGRGYLRGVGDHDAVFDHLDRCEFIDKFALVRASPAWAFAEATLGRARDYWRVFEEYVSRWVNPGDRSLLRPEPRQGSFRVRTRHGTVCEGLASIARDIIEIKDDASPNAIRLPIEEVAELTPVVALGGVFGDQELGIPYGPGAGAADGSIRSCNVVRRITERFSQGIRSALCNRGWDSIRAAAVALKIDAGIDFTVDPAETPPPASGKSDAATKRPSAPMETPRPRRGTRKNR